MASAVDVELVTGDPLTDLPDHLKARVEKLPHSRACGITEHPHGVHCSPDCPTCRGRTALAPMDDDVPAATFDPDDPDLATRRLLSTDDAAEWAREWVRVAREIEFGDDERGVIDEGWMIGWFANAIETGRSHAKPLLPTTSISDAELAVRHIHTARARTYEGHGVQWCVECEQDWPCETIAALDRLALGRAAEVDPEPF